jgi:hypothetical protein
VEDIDFRVNFVAENSNKLQKLGSQCVHIAEFRKFQNLDVKIMNVFTLGPTAQATLVIATNHEVLKLIN